ncbi:protein of unknown function [Methylorubrum extorquens]|uniref:Tc1-like transposase DDE domain-containing protein n=1 Tax=Methylorubrum extorquens TaxID=408 RepID=A0A2N9AYY5_METEX|nr:protein of unknown function [Methylorubrum extorquens]
MPDVQAGRFIGCCARRHRSIGFCAFLDQVEANVPEGLDVHLVLDNAATHKNKLIHDWLLMRPRWLLHFTPTSVSLLAPVEGWFALLAATASTRHVPSQGRSGSRHPRRHRSHQRRAGAVHLDQVNSRYHREHQMLLSTSFQLRSLGGERQPA